MSGRTIFTGRKQLAYLTHIASPASQTITANSATFSVGHAMMFSAIIPARKLVPSFAYLAGRATTVWIQSVQLDATKAIVRGQTSATVDSVGLALLANNVFVIQVAFMALVIDRTSATVMKVGVVSFVMKVSSIYTRVFVMSWEI